MPSTNHCSGLQPAFCRRTSLAVVPPTNHYNYLWYVFCSESFSFLCPTHKACIYLQCAFCRWILLFPLYTIYTPLQLFMVCVLSMTLLSFVQLCSVITQLPSLNPFMPSGFFYFNSLDKFISYISGVWLVIIIVMFCKKL